MSEEAALDTAPGARDGDLDAFEALVVRHVPAAWRVAVVVVGETLARELVADAFVTAWRGLPHHRDPGRFGPWLGRIVVDRGRSMLRRGGAVREIPVTAWRDGAPVHPHDGIGAADARELLESTFGSLPYDQRAVIALHYAAGLSLAEVGETLDVSAGTARSRLTTALEALRRRSGLEVADRAVSPWAPDSASRGPAPGGETARDAGPAPDAGARMPPQEGHVEAFVESLAAVAVPGDLAGAIVARVRAHPVRRPSVRLPLLTAAAGLLVTVSVAMAMGWEPPIDLVPGPPETATLAPPSAIASGAPSPGPESPPPAEAWEWATMVGTGAEIVADPTVPEAIGVTPDDPNFDPVLVIERRVVEGRTWVRIEQGGYGWDARFVWIPETIPSTAPTGYEVDVLRPTSWVPCDTSGAPTIESIATLTAAQRLACHGGASFTIGPVQVVRAWDRDKSQGTPAWLAGPMTTMLEGPRRPDGLVMTVPVHLDPALGLTLPEGAWVRATLHLDDPAAATCTRETTTPERPVGEPSDHVLWCRQQLVVTGYTGVPEPTPAEARPSPSPTLEGVSLLPRVLMAGRVGASTVWRVVD